MLTLRRVVLQGKASPHAGDYTMYEVVGLPSGIEAFIRRIDGTWKVIRVRNGIRKSWAEGFDTLEDAFDTLRADYEAPSGE